MAFSRGPSIVTDGLVLYLDAANQKSYSLTGSTWNDLSGNGNNGIIDYGVDFDTRNNGSIFFNEGAIVDIGNNTTFSFIQNTGIFTICVWVKPVDYTIPGQIMSTYRNIGEKGFSLGIGNNGILDFRIDNGSGNSYLTNNQIYNYFIDDNWIFITIVGNGTTIEYYRNGYLFSVNNLGSFSSGNTGRLLSIGVSNVLQNLSGYISIINIYNKLLKSNDVLKMFSATKSRYMIDNQVSFNFNDEYIWSDEQVWID